MRISVNYDNGAIFQHFGRTAFFKLYDVENGAVVRETLLPAAGEGHGALAAQLAQNHVDVAICGGLGTGMLNALQSAGITVCANVTGSADDAVKAYLAGSLRYSQETHGCHCHHA